MALLDDIADYLTSGSVASTIYAGHMPAVPDAAVCVYETGGVAPVHGMGNVPGRAKFERPRIQVVSRGEALGYQDARATAQAAFLLLDGMPQREINGTRYLWGAAVQSPFLMGMDEQARPLIAFNVDIVRAMSTST